MAESLEKILYVEDDTDIQEVAQMALEAVGGFTVKVCSSGQQAIEAAPDFDPDFILLDVMMPGMDGPTTLSELRKLSGFDTKPVAFMTAKVMKTEVDHYKELGAVGVIPKPFDPMTLSDQIRSIWETAAG